MFYPRSLSELFVKMNWEYTILFLSGPKGAGKTAFLRSLAKEERYYVDLNQSEELALAQEDPPAFLRKHGTPILIDGIHLAPALLAQIQRYSGEWGWPGDFWLISSHTCDILEGVTNDPKRGAGFLNLYGLSYEERWGEPLDLFHIREEQRKKIQVSIKEGGLPAAVGCADEEERTKYMEQYLDQCLTEICELEGVIRKTELRRFFEAVARHMGELVNYAVLAKEASITAPTSKKWLSMLVSAGLLFLQMPYVDERLPRGIELPRMFLTDTALSVHCNPEITEEKLFAQWVILELAKRQFQNGKWPVLYHYRDKDCKEVELLLKDEETLVPVAILRDKATERPAREIYRGFAKKGISVGEGREISLF